jgi:hypothetical protein
MKYRGKHNSNNNNDDSRYNKCNKNRKSYIINSKNNKNDNKDNNSNNNTHSTIPSTMGGFLSTHHLQSIGEREPRQDGKNAVPQMNPNLQQRFPF